jgi:hypothetical protein
VRRNDWSRQTRNAFSDFSTAGWQWNRQAELQAFVIAVGKDVRPALTGAAAGVMGLALGMRDALKDIQWYDYLTLGMTTLAKAGSYGRHEADLLKVKIEDLAKSLSKICTCWR